MTMKYIIARNSSGRPTLQHRLLSFYTTNCDLDVSGWSRAYQGSAIPALICLKCKKHVR